MSRTHPALRRHQRGYSIAEMLVVVAIIGIFSLIAVPQFISIYRASQTKASLRDFTSSVRRARQLAVTRGERVRVIVTPGTTGGASFEIDTGGTNITAPTWVLYRGSKHTLDPMSYFDATSTLPTTPSGTTREIDFLPSGTAVQPDNPNSATDSPAPFTESPTVVIRSSYKNLTYNQYTITITPTGGVSVAQSKWQ